MIARPSTLLTLSALSVFGAQPAAADLFGIRFSGRSPLYTIDPATGASARVGFTELSNASALAA